jgi:hypothetical protein
MSFKGHKYRIYVDNRFIKDVLFLVSLKPWQLDNVAKGYAEEHGIGWTGVKFIKVLNGAR